MRWFLALCVMLSAPVSAAELGKDLDPDELMFGMQVVLSSEAKEKLAENKKFPKLPSTPGLLVVSVYKDGPAKELEPYDLITAIGGKPMRSLDDYLAFIATASAGTEYTFAVQRFIRTKRSGHWKTGKLEIASTTKGDFALRVMEKRRDDFKKITFYKNKYNPNVSQRTDVNIYLSHEDGKNPLVFLRLQYASDDWLFIERYSIKIGEKTYVINCDFNDVNRDNSTRIWEWRDLLATGEIEEIVSELANSSGKDPVIRFHGRQYVHDHQITQEEIERIQLTLLVLKKLRLP